MQMPLVARVERPVCLSRKIASKRGTGPVGVVEGHPVKDVAVRLEAVGQYGEVDDRLIKGWPWDDTAPGFTATNIQPARREWQNRALSDQCCGVHI